MEHLKKGEMDNIAMGIGLMANYKPVLEDMISDGAVELLFGKLHFSYDFSILLILLRFI